MQNVLLSVVVLILMAVTSPITNAAESLKEDNQHIRTWNKFASDCLKLHKTLTSGKHLKHEIEVGGYAHQKQFYVEHRYLDHDRLISKVQWEKDNPDTLHSIEVYLYDKKGRVTRDYAAAFLPYYHNAPVQTLVSFHHYNGDLHAFRSFDASGYRVLERCTGKTADGEEINLILDEDELAEDPDNIIGSKAYNLCFAGLKQKKLGKYVVPQ